MPGPAPKPESKRRRYGKPKSYGAAEPTTAPAAARSGPRKLGIEDAHPLIASLWNTVQTSCEAAFYSATDWERLRLELWFANHTMFSGRPSAGAWEAVQHGLNELLLSPAVKRRAGRAEAVGCGCGCGCRGCDDRQVPADAEVGLIACGRSLFSGAGAPLRWPSAT